MNLRDICLASTAIVSLANAGWADEALPDFDGTLDPKEMAPLAQLEPDDSSGNAFAEAVGISDNGKVIAGTSSVLRSIGGGFGRYAQGVIWKDGELQNVTESYAGDLHLGGISGDGRAVWGNGISSYGAVAYYWSEAAGGVLVNRDMDINSLSSYATALSHDGTTLVGTARTLDASIATTAFRWSQASGFQTLGLGPSGEYSSVATALSGDGSVIVGNASAISGRSTAFVWTEATGMQAMESAAQLSSYSSSYANAISRDGSVSVGSAHIDPFTLTAFRWSEGGDGLELLSFPSDVVESAAALVSANGSVIVGLNRTASDARYFRWVWNGAEVVLQDLGVAAVSMGSNGLAGLADMTSDGNFIVGTTLDETNSSLRAFWWSEATQEIELGTLGGLASIATGVSEDGNIVVGWSQDAEGASRAFILSIAGLGADDDDPSGPMLDLVNTQTALGHTAQDLMQIASAHGDALRALGAYEIVGGGPAGVTVSSKGMGAPAARSPIVLHLAGLVREDRDTASARGLSFGLAGEVANGLQFGGVLQQMRGNALVESVRYEGPMTTGALYLRHRPLAGAGLSWKISAGHGAGDVDIRRPDALANTEAGHGVSALSSWGVQAELGWQMPLRSGEIMPYLRLGHLHTERGAYSEASDISMPFSFEAQTIALSTASLGVAGRRPMNSRSSLQYELVLESDLRRDVEPLSGSYEGGSVTLPAPAPENPQRFRVALGWHHAIDARSGLEARLDLGQQVYSDAPTVSLGLGYSLRF